MLRVASVLITGVFCTGIVSCSSTPRYHAGVEADTIRQLSRQWLAADVSRNVEAAVDMYADDAVEMPSNTPIVIGKEAIRKWYQNWLPNRSNSITFATTDVQVASSGDLAYERGLLPGQGIRPLLMATIFTSPSISHVTTEPYRKRGVR